VYLDRARRDAVGVLEQLVSRQAGLCLGVSSPPGEDRPAQQRPVERERRNAKSRCDRSRSHRFRVLSPQSAHIRKRPHPGAANHRSVQAMTCSTRTPSLRPDAQPHAQTPPFRAATVLRMSPGPECLVCADSATVAKQSSGGCDWHDRGVAVGIVRSGHVGTIALRECDRRARCAVPRNRSAAFGRLQQHRSRRWSGGDQRKQASVRRRRRPRKQTSRVRRHPAAVVRAGLEL
jgi:hypothetical protein